MIPFEQLKEMIERDNKVFSICHQCELLGISRSSLYYTPSVADPLELEIMKEIDLLYIQDTTRGTQRMHKALRSKGYTIGRYKVRSLMRLMRIKTVYCKPRTTICDPAKYKYPYLLRNLPITEANQVWVVNTINEAIQNHGVPKIINSDQGSQFTSNDYINYLKRNNIQISMDGKGRATDNSFIERFFRTIKHDKIYLELPENGTELHKCCSEFINFYNNHREHSSLGYETPAKLFNNAA